MSTIRISLVADRAGTGPATLTSITSAKAYYNFNQDSNILEQGGNISSGTDDATGVWTFTWSNNFSTALYTGDHGAGAQQSGNTVIANRNTSSNRAANTNPPMDLKSTSQYKMTSFDGAGGAVDLNGNGGTIIGALA